MYSLVTEIVIEASPPRVWAVLTDFAAYPLWNPFVPLARGSLAGDTRAGFEAMNSALKARVESGVV